MNFPATGTHIISMFILVCLWHWTVRRGNLKPSQQREEIRQQNRIASISFFSMLMLQLISLISHDPWMRHGISMSCAAILLIFAVCNSRQPESFWRKKRNQAFASVSAVALATIVPVIVTEGVFIPLLFSLVIIHICHSNNNRLLAESLQDLEAVQAKLLKMDAKVKSLSTLEKLYKSFLDASSRNGATPNVPHERKLG